MIIHNNKINRIFDNKKRNLVVLSQVISAIFGLILGKLIAVYISPEAFGLFNIQFGAYTFFFTLFFIPTIQFYKSTITSLYKKIGFSNYKISISITCLLVFIAVFSYLLIYNPLFVSIELIFIILLIIPFNAFFKILNDFNNVSGNINKYVIGNLTKSLFSIIILLFVLILGKKNVEGNLALWIMSLGSIIVGVFFSFNRNAFKLKNRIVGYRSFLKSKMKFGWPLMVMALWAWVNNYFDRYVIDYYIGLENVGIYNANYSLGSKFFLLLSPIFFILLTPDVYKQQQIVFKKLSIIKYVQFLLVIGILLLILIGLFYEEIGLLLLSKSYSSGFYIIFWIALSYLILAATQLYEMIFYSEKRTKILLYSNVVSAILNIILNILLIPFLGLYGAIFATLLAFILRFIIIFYNFKKI